MRSRRAGVPVILHEMRPDAATAAHRTATLAELVCSNSFRSDDAETNAVGVLHREMRRLGSLVMRAADAHQVPAGGALAVDRDGFADAVRRRSRGAADHASSAARLTGLPPETWGPTIIATGPLTSPALAEAILAATGEQSLAFFDAIAPIVHYDSIDFRRRVAAIALRQGRARAATPRPMSIAPWIATHYEAFVDALLAAEKTEFREFEGTPYFDGCLPIEVMAERGRETLRHGPMKPVGLTNAHAPDRKPYAVVQLRQDNALGTLFNMVGFQTKLKYGEQARIFRMIPGLERAEFARLGGLHRNTFLNSPRAARRASAVEGAAATALRRPDHRLRGLCRERRVGIDRRAPDGGRGSRACRSTRRRRPPPSARSSTTSPAATSS